MDQLVLVCSMSEQSEWVKHFTVENKDNEKRGKSSFRFMTNSCSFWMFRSQLWEPLSNDLSTGSENSALGKYIPHNLSIKGYNSDELHSPPGVTKTDITKNQSCQNPWVAHWTPLRHPIQIREKYCYKIRYTKTLALKKKFKCPQKENYTECKEERKLLWKLQKDEFSSFNPSVAGSDTSIIHVWPWMWTMTNVRGWGSSVFTFNPYHH